MNCVYAIAGNEEYARFRVDLNKVIRQLSATDAGHDHVGKKQVHRPAMLAREPQRLDAVTKVDDVISRHG